MNTSATAQGFKEVAESKAAVLAETLVKAMLGIFSRFPNLGPEGPEPDPSLRAQGALRAAHPRLRLKRRLLRSKDGKGSW